jgi:hypothetical protein
MYTIDKPHSRSRDHTCRRSGSNLSYIGIDAAIEQGCQKASALLQHSRHYSRLGKMMWTAIERNQVTAGVGFAILTEPWRSLPHAVGQRIPSLCEFLASSECTIDIAYTYTVCTRRIHGRILMEDAMTGDLTDSEMRAINRCRLFLQVECLPDVCTADGLTTDPGLQAKSPKVTSKSKIKWPRQGLPTPDFIKKGKCAGAARMVSIEVHFLDRLEIRLVRTSTHQQGYSNDQ